jgi:phosphohistidine swiveling domain-containing protein
MGIGDTMDTPLDSVSGPDTQWTRVNVGEAFPGVITTLQYDFVVRLGELGIRGAYHEQGAISAKEAEEADHADERVMSPFKGRVSININKITELNQRLSGGSGSTEAVLGHRSDAAPTAKASEQVAAGGARDLSFLTTLAPRALALYDKTAEDWRALTTPAACADIAAAPARWQLARDHFLAGAIMMTHVTTYLGEVYGSLAAQCSELGQPELLTRINGGYGDTHDDELSADLWALSHDRITMGEFLLEHGFQGNRAGDIAATVWREDPELLRSVLAPMATMPESQSHGAKSSARVADRLSAEQELLDAAGEENREATRERIETLHRYTVLREKVKVVSQRSIDIARAITRALGADLAQRGEIAEPDDAFHLLASEFVTGRGSDLRERVAGRKALAAQYERIEVPLFFVGNPPDVEATESVVEMADKFQGLGVSPGVVEGRARVILDPVMEDPLDPGEILVCRSTDPSWVGHFLLASALVIDLGGPLSHGAIVARELGVPCVVETGAGTTMVRTGDLVRVDGGAGTVEVLERAGQ